MASVVDLLVDRSLALRADPYRYIGRRCRDAGRDAIELRLLGRRAIAMTGPRAAALFYDPRRFVRAGAAPGALRATLLGQGGVQSLDGSRHAARKALFVLLLRPESVAKLVEGFRTQLDRAAREWAGRGAVPLHDAMQPVLARAVSDWAGVSVPAAALPTRTRQIASLYVDAMSAGHLRARRHRREAERWLALEIEALRAGRTAGRGEALRAVAQHLDADGTPLSPRIAAVELLNLLRPTVAVSVWVTFAAHALQRAPEWRELLRAQPSLLGAFVQEVRRDYPFIPMVAARVRESFEWDGLRFVRGRRALLDLYGTDHDPRCWESPERFAPERFLRASPGPYEFVPQGGGDVRAGHRCPGEGVAVEVTKAAVAWLVRSRYRIPQSDLALDMRRVPALPRAGLSIADLRPG